MCFHECLTWDMRNFNIFNALNFTSFANLVKSSTYLAYKENKDKISDPELSYAKYVYLKHVTAMEWDRDLVHNIL